MESVDILTKFGLGLQNRLHTFVGHLSGGERQIVALLCILASGANILCLDEFTSALDIHSSNIAEQLIIHANETAGITALLVSHSGTNIRVSRTLDVSSKESSTK
jgi:putative ABC transport system ATP-binding protein